MSPSLTDWLEGPFEELSFVSECFITSPAGEMLAAPGLAQRSEDVALRSDFCTLHSH